MWKCIHAWALWSVGRDPRTLAGRRLVAEIPKRTRYPELEQCIRCDKTATVTWSKGEQCLGFCREHARISEPGLRVKGWTCLVDVL